MGDPITTGHFPQFLEKGVEMTEMGLKNALKEAVWPKFTKKRTAKLLTERVTDYEDMGGMSTMPEGSRHPAQTFAEGHSQAFTQHVWGGKAVITRLMREFDQYDLVTKLMRHLRVSAAAALEIIFAYYLENGQTAVASVLKVGGLPIANTSGGDGQALFYASHTYKSSSQTWSNYSSAALALSRTSIGTIYTSVARRLNSQGRPLNLSIVDIIYPADLRQAYLELKLSEKQPDTANNAINAARMQFKGQGIQHKWLGDTADWYALTDAQDGQLEYREGWPVRVRGPLKVDEDTENEGIFIDVCLAHGANALHSIYKVA